MALADFIPVVLFALASIYLMRDLYGKMSRVAFALFAAGIIEVTSAGFLKAAYNAVCAGYLRF